MYWEGQLLKTREIDATALLRLHVRRKIDANLGIHPVSTKSRFSHIYTRKRCLFTRKYNTKMKRNIYFKSIKNNFNMLYMFARHHLVFFDDGLLFCWHGLRWGQLNMLNRLIVVKRVIWVQFPRQSCSNWRCMTHLFGLEVSDPFNTLQDPLAPPARTTQRTTQQLKL